MLCPPHTNPNLEVWSMRRFSPYTAGLVSILALSLATGCGESSDVQQTPQTKNTQRTKIDKNGNAIFGQEAAPKSAAIEEPRTQASTESQEAATPSAPTEPATPSPEELATADVEPVKDTEVAVADAMIETTAKQTVDTQPPTIKERPVVSQPKGRRPRSLRRSGDALQKSRRKKRQKPNNALRKRNERKLNKPKLRELRKQSVVRISKKRKMLKSSARRMLRPD